MNRNVQILLTSSKLRLGNPDKFYAKFAAKTDPRAAWCAAGKLLRNGAQE